MVVAFALVNCHLGMEEKAASHIRQSRVVSRCDIVWGAFDIVAELQVDYEYSIYEHVERDLRPVEGVRSVYILKDKEWAKSSGAKEKAMNDVPLQPSLSSYFNRV